MKIIKQELQFEKCLKQRIDFICEFSKIIPTFINGSIRKKATHTFLSNEEIENIKKYVPQAKDFYEHMGFKVYQRNELDDQGNPYPVLYMRLEK